MAPGFRPLTVSLLALVHDRSQKQIAAATGRTAYRISQILRGEDIQDDQVYEELLAGIPARPAEVWSVTRCLDALQAAQACPDLTDEQLIEIELAARQAERLTRERLIEALRLSRAFPVEGYPKPADLLPARRRAAELLERLKGIPEEPRFAVVAVAEEYQSWALCEAACEESVRQASRDLESAASWARLARAIAERVPGPEPWRRRNTGYAAAHEVNILRVAGELKEADIALPEAKRIWRSGSDPHSVLDPGRILEIKLRYAGTSADLTRPLPVSMKRWP